MNVSDYAHLWDGRSREWVVARFAGGRLLPLNAVTGESFVVIEDDHVMAQIVERMLGVGRPLVEYGDWWAKQATVLEARQTIETLTQRVWRLRTRTDRATGQEAQLITQELPALLAELNATPAAQALRQVARQLWRMHEQLLELERRSGRG